MGKVVTYEGKPCPKGCGTTRYKKSGSCVTCTKNAALAYAKANPEKQAESFKKAIGKNPKLVLKAYYYAALKLAKDADDPALAVFISDLYKVALSEVLADLVRV
jgi:hypothetical protein